MCFASGSTVTVFNQKLSGEPIIEGRAKIVKSTELTDQYRVKFIDGNDRGTYSRFVYGGECQRDPPGYLAKAQADWRARAQNPVAQPTGLVQAVEREMALLGL